MNKVIVKQEDAINLKNWALNYQEQIIKTYDYCPMRAIKLICFDEENNKKEITCVRDGNRLEMLFNETNDFKYRVIYNHIPGDDIWETVDIKFLTSKEKKKRLMKLLSENTEMFEMFTGSTKITITTYLWIMALMIFSNEFEPNEEDQEIKELKEPKKKNTKTHKNLKPPKKQTEGITYILKKTSSNEMRINRKGSHAKPNGQFNVRGHYRHLHNGKVIWIKEYVKGKGKEQRDKTYKIKSHLANKIS